MKSLMTAFAERLMRCPAAPYFEEATRAAAESICLEEGLDCARDNDGNLLVSHRKGKGRPLALAAHLDHPGFEIVKRKTRRGWLARFRGGVGDSYFKAGTALRLMPQAASARLGKRRGKEKEFEVEGLESFDGEPLFAVWEVEDYAVRRGKIHGRACDDLIGCAAILAAMAQLKRQRARVNVLGVLARAEEVGFHGALRVAEEGLIPSEALVVSIETSRELPSGKMGQGVVVRVGDRSSIFDSDATRFLTEVAGKLAADGGGFQFQRALMSGGTCEGTAYQEQGYQTAALCVALGNYHNCGSGDRIAAEHVDISDVEGLVKLLVGAAKAMRHFDKLAGKLPRRLRSLSRDARREFRRRD